MSSRSIETININTSDSRQMLDITSKVQGIIDKSGIVNGTCSVFIPHTTAAVTVNENADPDVVKDMILGLENMIEHDLSFRHAEGNSPAHIKSTIVGVSESFFISGGRLVLGTWQGIYFCEFDGPRTRKAVIKISDN